MEKERSLSVEDLAEARYTVGELIYDANIYDGFNTDLSDLSFYKKWLPQRPGAQVLELCCGTGRLTIPLAQAGCHITGVDITPSMLDRAKAKASEANLAIRFVEGDMRTLALEELYELIFIPFNSIHHLYTNEDLFKTFATVQSHLKAGGLFLFDCFNPSLQHIVEGEKTQMEVANFQTQDGRRVVIRQEMQYESHTQVNRIAWHHFIDDTFHSTQQLDMRMYYPQELDAYLQQGGFEIVHKFGGFQEEPFDGRGGKQVFVCRVGD